MGQINARDWIFEASTGASTFVQVGGLESFSLNPSEGEETADTTTFDSAGTYEQQIMQRGASLELEGKHLTDEAGVQDPGQAAVEALAEGVGDASLGTVRFRHVTEQEWTVWTATVSLGEKGGGTNDKSSWGCTVTRSGAATAEAVVAG